MAFVNTLRQWHEAVALVEKGELASALRVFHGIEEKTSKIAFNIGCLHLNNNELDSAEKAFDRSIGKDGHLAIAFFQRGITFFKKEKFEESLLDFQQAFKELRGNHLIDYKPLGLRYKLYACEVLHNMGLVQAQLGQWEKAQENLLSALSLRTEAKFSHIDLALESILKQKLFALVKVRSELLFQPNRHYVAELEKRDYLGKAKVVSSVVPEDEFSGFAPLQPQIEEVLSTPQVPEVLRALEGEPHTVLYEFEPETREELAVLPGNIVFVLQRGADNWASVVFNERRGLVPYNYLEPLDITVTSKQEQDGAILPAAPRRQAPGRPQRQSDLHPHTLAIREPDPQIDAAQDAPGCLLKVHFLYTIVIRVDLGLPYGSIVQKISNKIKLPPTVLTLSYMKADSSTRVAIGEAEMDAVWSSAQTGHLTLWCHATEGTGGTVPGCVRQVVALFPYERSTPEDLSLQPGDIITVLSKVNDAWLEGECNGRTGIFPVAFVEDLVTDQ